MHDSFVREPSYYANHAFILQFASRGYFDALTRVIDHRFFNESTGEHEKAKLRKFLTGRPTWSNLPNRFILMKALKQLPVVDIDVSLPALQSKTCIRSLFGIFRRVINTSVNFACPDFSSLELAFEE